MKTYKAFHRCHLSEFIAREIFRMKSWEGNIILLIFVILHIAIGMLLIYTNGKLPKMITVFATVFLVGSFLYWGIVLMDIMSKAAGFFNAFL